MALSEAEWVAKLKGWVPAWWFEAEPNATAIITGVARVFSTLEADIDAQVALTYLDTSEEPELDAMGDERTVDRLPSETDASYAARIRNIVNQSNYPAIKALVDSLLIVGESTIREHMLGDMIFMSRESCYNRREIFTDIFYNVFSIIVAKQLHDPYSFLSREAFMSREDFVGSNESNLNIYEQIVAAVNKMKAFGVLYRLVETEA